MELYHLWFLFTIASVQYSSINGLIFNVSDYGAYPNDNIDDTNSTQNAIYMATASGSNNIVIFQAGTYDLTAALYIYNAVNLTVMGQGQEATTLLGHSPASIFIVMNSPWAKITMLAIDFDPLPFTAGYVTNVTASYLIVQVVPPHKADVGRRIETILRYDPNLMRPAIGPNAYERYNTPIPNINTTLVGNGTLRVPLAASAAFAVGDAVIVRYAFATHALYAQNASDFTLQSITIYTAWYMGIFTIRTPRLNIIDYHVKRYGGRWMSTAADCMHFADSREYINIYDSSCEAQGDDGLNVQAFYFSVAQVVNSSALIIQEYNWPDTLNFGFGTQLEFSSSQQPFSVYSTATVASSSIYSTNSSLFTFISAINASVGDWVCVADTPTLTIRNLTVANSRARGVLLQTRNIHITKSLFNRTSGPAVLIQPTLYWHEGPGTRNTTLDYNMYISCNEGITQEKGMIALTPYPTQLVPVLSQIRITSSTFINGQYSGSVIQCANAADVLISDNYITTSNSTATILLCNTKNISASNNCVNNNQTSVTQFYTYDTTNPCLTNLTSQINLQPTGFNSIFSSPVIATNLGIALNVNQTPTTTVSSMGITSATFTSLSSATSPAFTSLSNTTSATFTSPSNSTSATFASLSNITSPAFTSPSNTTSLAFTSSRNNISAAFTSSSNTTSPTFTSPLNTTSVTFTSSWNNISAAFTSSSSTTVINNISSILTSTLGITVIPPAVVVNGINSHPTSASNIGSMPRSIVAIVVLLNLFVWNANIFR